MTRFHLVFRDSRGERSEVRDSNMHNEPHVNGKPIIDGGTYRIHGVDWLIRLEHVNRDGTGRYICTPVAEER